MQPNDHKSEIRAWLEQQGHSPDDIAKIEARLAKYDQAVVRAAIFDSIAQGQFDLDSIIRDALSRP
jgi:hypothetical protein